MLVDHHYKTLKKTHIFLIHLAAIYTLTFLIFSSLIICVSRDPGPVTMQDAQSQDYGAVPEEDDGDESIGVMEALMGEQDEDDIMTPGRWCRKCWVS